MVSSLLIVFTSSCPRVEAYATPYVIGKRLAAVNGFGTMPLTIRPRITETTGSDALITVLRGRGRKRSMSSREHVMARLIFSTMSF